jgi:hypothetical protein
LFLVLVKPDYLSLPLPLAPPVPGGTPSPSSRPQEANPETGLLPPLCFMGAPDTILKISFIAFLSCQGDPGGKHPPPHRHSPKIFISKNPGGILSLQVAISGLLWGTLGLPPCPTTYRRPLTPWMAVSPVSIPSLGRVGSLFELEEDWMILARNSMRL